LKHVCSSFDCPLGPDEEQAVEAVLEAIFEAVEASWARAGHKVRGEEKVAAEAVVEAIVVEATVMDTTGETTVMVKATAVGTAARETTTVGATTVASAMLGPGRSSHQKRTRKHGRYCYVCEHLPKHDVPPLVANNL
jgi:hypothetical protein